MIKKTSLTPEKVNSKIVKWLTDYAKNAKSNGFVIVTDVINAAVPLELIENIPSEPPNLVVYANLSSLDSVTFQHDTVVAVVAVSVNTPVDKFLVYCSNRCPE